MLAEIAVFLLRNLSRHVSFVFAPWSLMSTSHVVEQEVTKCEIFDYTNYITIAVKQAN